MTDLSPQQLSAELAREWREARTALLELAERIPETRAYKATDRAGWTIKHELAHLLSLDAEVTHLLAVARHNVADAAPAAVEAIKQHLEPAALRRRRGQAMHAAQELRLAPLRQQLASAGEHTAASIEAAAEALSAPVGNLATTIGHTIEHEAGTAADYVRARLKRSREALQTVTDALG